MSQSEGQKQNSFLGVLIAIIILMFVIAAPQSYARGSGPVGVENNSVNEVHLSVYLKRIFNVNVSKSYVDVKYLLYLTHNDKVKDVLNNIRLMNAKNEKLVYSKKLILKDGKYLTVAEFTAQIHHHFSMRNYPFDSQSFQFVFEDTNDDVSQVKLIPTKIKDTQQLIDSNALLYVPEWRLNKVRLVTRVHREAQVFESAIVKKTRRLPEVVLHIELTHKGWRQFIALYSTLYLAVVLSIVSLLFPPSKYVFGARAGLLGAAVWSLVGNHILTHGILRNVSIFNLTDILQLLASLFVASSLIMTLVMTYCVDTIEYAVRQRYYRRFTIVITSVFVVLNCFFIFNALY